MIEPNFDRVLILREEFEQVSSGGIVIAASKKNRETKENVSRGRVVAVGPGRVFDSGHFEPVKLKPDDKVLFDEESAYRVSEGGFDYLVLREGQILGVLK